MAYQIQTLSSEVVHNDETELEEEEVEKLEADVNRMAQKILEYRNSLPDQLKNALASTLVAQRPIVSTHLDSESVPQPSAQIQALPCSTLPTNIGVDVGTPSIMSPAEPVRRRSGRLRSLASSPASSNPSVTTTPTQKRGRGRASGGKRKQQLAFLDAGESIESDKGPRPQLAEEDRETVEKTRLLKQKISSNVSALPTLLKRMKECISRIDNLQSCNGFIHRAFKRKRIC